jgi:putative membrane protein
MTVSGAVRALGGVYLRGLLMGAADIVPGVSGGTIAFITGIYGRLVAAIAAFDVTLLRLLLGGRIAAAWEHVDGSFLVALMAGIGTSLLGLSHALGLLLERQPLLLWSFFFGLVAASALLLLRRVSTWHLPAWLGLAAGVLLAVAVALAPALSLPAQPLSFFFAGALAICAMILPGVSGSFILVLLGLYPALLDALRELQLATLALFAAGAACGLLAFSRLLNLLLHRHHSTTLATLTGFLVGSLLLLWPWKRSEGAAVELMWPSQYAAQVADAQLLFCLLCAVVGVFAVWLIEYRWGGPER